MRCLPLVLLGLLATGCASSGTTTAGPADASAAKRHHTSRPLDLAINGDGYFIVKAPGGGYLFTRLGALSVSDTGELVNEDGYQLYPPVVVPDAKADVAIESDGAVRLRSTNGAGRLIGQIALARFDKPDAVQRDREYLMPLDADSVPITGKPGAKGLGTIVVGEIED